MKHKSSSESWSNPPTFDSTGTASGVGFSVGTGSSCASMTIHSDPESWASVSLSISVGKAMAISVGIQCPKGQEWMWGLRLEPKQAQFLLPNIREIWILSNCWQNFNQKISTKTAERGDTVHLFHGQLSASTLPPGDFHRAIPAPANTSRYWKLARQTMDII